MIGEYHKTQMSSNPQNFPLDCFLDQENDNIYVIYRNGQFLTFYEEEKVDYIKRAESTNALQKKSPRT